MKNTKNTKEALRDFDKVLHPGFGALNAKEWFLLIEMHYRHHLSQLERLKQNLKLSANLERGD
ncbi:hypothetical protein J7J47_01565 [Halomonas sp. ISL-60]|nr:hypothetical protein [Halomonas sp. ISL-60]